MAISLIYEGTYNPRVVHSNLLFVFLICGICYIASSNAYIEASPGNYVLKLKTIKLSAHLKSISVCSGGINIFIFCIHVHISVNAVDIRI